MNNALRIPVSEKEKASNVAKIKVVLHKVKDNNEYSKKIGVLLVLADAFLYDPGYNVHVENHVVIHGGAKVSKFLGCSFDLGGILNALNIHLEDKVVSEGRGNEAENAIGDKTLCKAHEPVGDIINNQHKDVTAIVFDVMIGTTIKVKCQLKSLDIARVQNHLEAATLLDES